MNRRVFLKLLGSLCPVGMASPVVAAIEACLPVHAADQRQSPIKESFKTRLLNRRMPETFTFERYISDRQDTKDVLVNTCRTDFSSSNPVYILSIQGNGSTHLLGATYHELRHLYPGKVAIYLHVERLLAEIRACQNGNSVGDLVAYLKGVDYLLIDDLQCFAWLRDGARGWEIYRDVLSSRVEHWKGTVSTFSNIESSGEWRPAGLPRLPNEREVFSSRPSPKRMVSILKQAARADGADLPEWLFEMLVDSVLMEDTNVRCIKGFGQRLQALHSSRASLF